MQRFYPDILIVLMVMIPSSAGASSRLYDADAIVAVRNGKPCFSYPAGKEKLFGYSLAVSRLGSHETAVWEILAYNRDRKKVPEPSCSETCIEYGVSDFATEENKAAEPLAADVPYRVFINVYEAPVGENRYRFVRKVGAEFCISNNEAGEAVIIGASNSGTGAWRCLKPGESLKRGFWQRLFGK